MFTIPVIQNAQYDKNIDFWVTRTSSRLLLIFILSLLTSFSFAIEDEAKPAPSSTFLIGAGYSSDESRDYALAIDLEFSTFQHIGGSLSTSKSSDDGGSFNNFSLFTSTSAYEKYSIGAEYNRTDSTDEIETETFSSDLNLNLENWQLSITPQLSTISFFLDLNRLKYLNINSKGFNISGGFFGLDNYYFFANYAKNFFSDSPLQDSLNISNENAITNFSEKTSSLQDHFFSLTAGRFFSWGSIDISWSYAEIFNVARWLNATGLTLYSQTISTQTLSSSTSFTINNNVSLGLSFAWQSLSHNDSDLISISSDLSYTW